MTTLFSMDSWWWKIALILSLVGVREYVRLSSRVVRRLPNGSEERGVSENGKFWIELADSAAIAFGLVLFIINPFLLHAFYIPSGSMEDTLHINDRVLVSKFVYRVQGPKAGDVVVFLPPNEADSQEPGDNFIKRCFGAPGDVVYANNKKYYRNGKLLAEPYVKWSGGPDGGPPYDLKIVDGHVYTRDISPYAAFNATPAPWVHEGHANSGDHRDGVPYPDQPSQSYIQNHAPEAVPSGKYLMLGDHRDHSSDGHVWGFVPRANVVGKAFCVFWPPSRIGLLDKMSLKTSPTPAADDAPQAP